MCPSSSLSDWLAESSFPSMESILAFSFTSFFSADSAALQSSYMGMPMTMLQKKSSQKASTPFSSRISSLSSVICFLWEVLRRRWFSQCSNAWYLRPSPTNSQRKQPSLPSCCFFFMRLSIGLEKVRTTSVNIFWKGIINNKIRQRIVQALIALGCSLLYVGIGLQGRDQQSIMEQGKQGEGELGCAFCRKSFEEASPPLIFCRGGHLSCRQCLFQKTGEYEYASFLCPLCLSLACRATAISCPWLLPLLASLRQIQEGTASERAGWMRERRQLEEALAASRSSESVLRGRLQELERRKSRFSQNWKKAIQSVVGRRSGEAPWNNQELFSFEKYPQKLINQLDRLCAQTQRLQGEIDRLKQQNRERASRIGSNRPPSTPMELSWGGPFTKSVETPKKKMRTTYDMDSASTNGEQRGRRHKIEGYLASNFMEVFKEKMRITEQINQDKRIGAKYKTCKKYFSMKIEELDDKFITHPKYTRLHPDPRRKERA